MSYAFPESWKTARASRPPRAPYVDSPVAQVQVTFKPLVPHSFEDYSQEERQPALLLGAALGRWWYSSSQVLIWTTEPPSSAGDEEVYVA